MKADTVNAKKWLITVQKSTESNAYQDAANQILEEIDP